MNIGIVELIVKMIAMQSYKSEESYGDSRNRKLQNRIKNQKIMSKIYNYQKIY